MDTADTSVWVDQYARAWNSNNPAEISALFTEDALYRTGPFDAAWAGRDAIVRKWLDRKDAPGSTTFRYELLATSPDSAVVRGWTQYRDPAREYSNIWLVRCDSNGRCREFTEWWVERCPA